jgi:hypothetical protein
VVVVAASLVASATVAVVVPVAVTAFAVDVAVESLRVASVTAVAALAVAVHPRTNAKSPTESMLRRAGKARRTTPVAHPVTKTLVKFRTGADDEGRA